MGTVQPFYKIVVVEGRKIRIELDTSTAVSYNDYKLKKAKTQLKTYTGVVIMPKEQVGVQVEGKKCTHIYLTTISRRRVWSSSVRTHVVIKIGSTLEREPEGT